MALLADRIADLARLVADRLNELDELVKGLGDLPIDAGISRTTAPSMLTV